MKIKTSELTGAALDKAVAKATRMVSVNNCAAWTRTRRVKTSELTGAALDWVVARCEYDNRRYSYGSPCFNAKTQRVYESGGLQKIGVNFAPSSDWKQGGPIIERENISAISHNKPNHWVARTAVYPPTYFQGPTPLIAAMRCYVASKLGDEVEIPEELK